MKRAFRYGIFAVLFLFWSQVSYGQSLASRCASLLGQLKDSRLMFRPSLSADSVEGDLTIPEIYELINRLNEFWTDQLKIYELPFKTPKIKIIGADHPRWGAYDLIYFPPERAIYIPRAYYSVERDRFRFMTPDQVKTVQRYTISHEFAHHVQRELAFFLFFHLAGHGLDTSGLNALQVIKELQADAMAGFFLSHNPKNTNNGVAASDRAVMNYVGHGGDGVSEFEKDGKILGQHGTREMRETWYRRGCDARGMADLLPFTNLLLLTRLGLQSVDFEYAAREGLYRPFNRMVLDQLNR